MEVYDKNGTKLSLLQDSDIESDSNENGEYIKFENGLLIQWGDKDVTFNNALEAQDVITYPIPFESTDYAVCGNMTGGSTTYISPIMFNRVNKEYCDVIVRLVNTTNNQSVTRGLNWFAIGRWK